MANEAGAPLPSGDGSEQAGTWDCTCGYQNEAADTKCDICDRDRFAETEVDKAPTAVGWTCLFCNKFNSLSRSFCMSCSLEDNKDDSCRASKRLRPGTSRELNLSELDNSDDDDEIHVAYESYEKNLELVPNATPKGLLIDLYPHQQLGLDFLTKSEINPKYRGSILADDMGLGKTIQTIALICGRPATQDDLQHCVKTTLIVCPVALADQWKEELDAACPRLRCVIYHGTNRRENLKYTIGSLDCVITTYSVLQQESKTNPRSSIILRTRWYRIVLDEAHMIKNHLTVCSQALYDIKSLYRLCLTGTPIQNSMQDLGSLFRFLGVKPWCKAKYFNKIAKEINDLRKRNKEEAAARKFAPVASLLRTLLLRRHKQEILKDLPERFVETIGEEFDEDEREIYRSIEEQSIVRFNRFLKEDSVLQNQCTILVMLLRLRQCCCHPALLPVDNTQSSADDPDLVKPSSLSQEILQRLDQIPQGQLGAQECGICLDIALNQPVVSTCCGQIWCKECFSGSFKVSGSCPYCRAPSDEVNMADLKEAATTLNRFSELGDPLAISGKLVEKCNQIIASTKIKKLLSMLKDIRDTDPTEKVIVFSQFTSFLDLIQPVLLENNFKLLRFDGTMNREQKTNVLNMFKTESSHTILLGSLKCASLGLNLTCARRVFLMDLWWNPAVEEQAFDRCHRLGQKRDVYITRITISNSIEDRIIELQESKRQLAQAALGEGEFKLPAATKLSVEDFIRLFRSSYA